MRRSKSDRAAADGRVVSLRSRLMWCLYWCVYWDAAERSRSKDRLPRLVRAFANVIAERQREPVPKPVPPKKWGRTLTNTDDGMDEFEAAQATAKSTKAARRLAAENAGYQTPKVLPSSRKAFHQDAGEEE